MLRKFKSWFSRVFLDRPPVTYNCQMSGACYCMRPHGSGFVVERSTNLDGMLVLKTVALVEAGGTDIQLAHRFLDLVERDAFACQKQQEQRAA